MKTKPLMCGEPIIDIERDRYEQLIKAEHELQLMREYLKKMDGYTDITPFKTMFNV